jgi:hypothetical protein
MVSVQARGRTQVESSVSIVQRQGLTPNDLPNREAVAQRLRLYEARANRQPRPFAWPFPRAKLAKFLKRLAVHGVIVSGDLKLLSNEQVENVG